VFDSEVQTVFAPRTAAHKDAMKRHIESIHAGGTTNLSGGLLQGIQNVMQSRGENTVNRVILLSDGHANEGITEPAKLAAIAKEFHSLGIGVTTMGVGDGFDEELMERIADHGGGNFYFIEKPEEIPGIFARELEGLMSVTAQNATLKLRPSESARIVRVYGYPSEAIENGGLKLTLGDVYDQEVKSVLIEMAFDPHAAGRHEVLEVQWDYADVTDGARLCSLVYPIEAAFTNDIDLLLQPPNPHVEKKVQITESALAIEQAIEAFDRGDTETGKKLLQRQADAMLLAAIRSEDEELREEAQLLYSQLEQFEYSDKTRKVLHEQIAGFSMHRSN